MRPGPSLPLHALELLTIPEPVSRVHHRVVTTVRSPCERSNSQSLPPLLSARLEHPSPPRRTHAGTESVSSLSLSLFRLVGTFGHRDPLQRRSAGYSNSYYSFSTHRLSNGHRRKRSKETDRHLHDDTRLPVPQEESWHTLGGAPDHARGTQKGQRHARGIRPCGRDTVK